MGNIMEYGVGFQGLDKAIAQWTVLDRLIKDVKASSGGMLGGGNINTGGIGHGNNVVIPTSGASTAAAAGAAAGTAVAARTSAAAAKGLQKVNEGFNKISFTSPKMLQVLKDMGFLMDAAIVKTNTFSAALKNYRQNQDVWSSAVSNANAAKQQGVKKYLSNLGYEYVKTKNAEGLTEQNLTHIKSGRIIPRDAANAMFLSALSKSNAHDEANRSLELPKSMLERSTNILNSFYKSGKNHGRLAISGMSHRYAGLGKFLDLAGPDSAFFSWRNKPPVMPPLTFGENLRLGMQTRGGGVEKLFSGEGIRELFRAGGLSRHLGNVVASFGKLGVVAGALLLSFFALHEAIKALSEGIKDAADAYQEAAKQGLNVAQSNQISKAFAAIGMQTPDLSSISSMLGSGNTANTILQAAQGGQLGAQGQQLLNMSSEFRQAMANGASSAIQLQMASKASFNLTMDMKNIGEEWKTLWAQAAEQMYPVLHGLLQLTGGILKFYNFIEMMNIARNPLNLYSGGNFTQRLIGGGENGNNHQTSFEKMGFVMHGSSGEHYQAQIRNNTKETVTKLDGILFMLGAMHGMSRMSNPMSLGQAP